MKRNLILFLILVLSQICSAQMLKFMVKDIKTEQPIEGVEVFSHEAHDKIAYTSKKGIVKFDVRKTDTLVFFKKNFAPFYLQIDHKNFDTINHVIHLKMKMDDKTVDNRLPMKFNSLNTSNYDFAHDSTINNEIKITRYEVPDSDPVKDRSFHFVEIKLDEKSNIRSPYTRR
ncbi:MAG: hypothetical protein H7329_02625 [Opitutaceae bacterium]|nr:hypothetical protein [Cytophagales bacterium]